MHPNPAFRGAADTDPLAQIAAIGFARIFAVTPLGPRVAHAPVVRVGAALRFHLARANDLAKHLDGATALLLAEGPNGYVSANWYADAAGNVPTWNYVAIEAEGVARGIDRAALIDLLDAAAATFEPRVGEDWTRAKMDPARFEAMVGAIQGFELTPATFRATYKLSQNRKPDDAARIADHSAALGNHPLAQAMRPGRPG